MKWLLIALLSTSLFAYKDFGVDGRLYDIIEEDFMITLKKGIDELQKTFTPEYVQSKIIEEVNKQAFQKSLLPVCQKDNQFSGINYQYLDTDIINPAGRIVKKKGEAVLVRSKKPLNICFVSASNKIELINQINYFDKTVKELTGKEEECTYMVSDGNVVDLMKELKKTFYPTGPQYESRFNVKCYPAFVHIEEDMIYNYEMSIEHFKHGEK